MQSTQPYTAPAQTRRQRVLLVINADTSRQPEPPRDRTVERLADYTALRTALGGAILDWQALDASRAGRLLRRVCGKGVALAVLGVARRARYDLYYCDSENNGLVLALLLKLTRTRKPLLMIGHWITPSKKAVLFRRLHVQSHISRIFLHSSRQYELAEKDLHIPPEKLRLLPYQVDTQFWRAENATVAPDQPPYICTAGLEFRDYPTLIEAVRDLPIAVRIGAASHWSKRTGELDAAPMPPNVTVRAYSYTELRDLYAGCRFVVVPLQDVNFQAGITVILEAMAMGKAVIVSRSEGQGDTIVDRRKTTRSIAPRPTTGNLAPFLGGIEAAPTAPTGYYVAVGDAAELRRAIQRLLDNPAEAEELGRRGRQLVETTLRVEDFAARIAHTVAGVLDEETGKQRI